MVLSRSNRCIAIGIVVALLGIGNILYGSSRVRELLPQPPAQTAITDADSQLNPLPLSDQPMFAVPPPAEQLPKTIAGLKHQAATEYYQFVVSGGKVLSAFGALLVIFGILVRRFLDPLSV